MGFFSYKCVVCELTILNDNYSFPLNELAQVIAIDYKGEVYQGSYDGYGRVAGVDLMGDGRNGIMSWSDMYEKYQPMMFHQVCYIMAKHTSVYIKASKDCDFQGFFIDEDDVLNLIAANETFMMNMHKMSQDFKDYVSIKLGVEA